MDNRRQPQSAGDVLERAAGAGEGGRTTVGEIFDALGTAVYGSVYLLVGVITITPIGAIPGMSTATGVIVILLGMQQLVGRRHPWLPGRVLHLSVPHERLAASLRKIRPLTDRLERVIRPRLRLFLGTPFMEVMAVGVMLLGAAMVPLEAVPFGADVPGAGLLLLGLGLVARDGLLVLIGLLALLGTGWLLYAVFL